MAPGGAVSDKTESFRFPEKARPGNEFRWKGNLRSVSRNREWIYYMASHAQAAHSSTTVERNAMSYPSLASGSFRLVSALLWPLFAACLPAPAAELTNTPVSLPPGETFLTDIGIYRVFWQSYGQPPVAMPGAWMGHFDAHSGISYQPWGRVLGRTPLLMHSPWHVPPGKAWVDYPLALPKTSPIRLTFGIAMGPDVACRAKATA